MPEAITSTNESNSDKSSKSSFGTLATLLSGKSKVVLSFKSKSDKSAAVSNGSGDFGLIGNFFGSSVSVNSLFSIELTFFFFFQTNGPRSARFTSKA